MDNPLGSTPERDWQAIGVASGLGCTVVASLLLCVVGGILLDRWLGTSPVLTLIGVLLGFFAAGYSLYELVVISDPNRGRVRLKKSTDHAPGISPGDR